jgi:hypothetical protein
MKIIKIVGLILIGLTINSVFGQAEFGPHKWTATIKVVGEDNTPLADANVSVQYSIIPQPHDPNEKSYGEITGKSDTNGILIASHADKSLGLGINVTKAGYYTSHTGYQFYFDDKRRNPSFTLTLKKIGKPIPMYAKRQEMKIQKEDEPLGFDLEAGDWVTPNGKGEHTDLIFTVHRKIISEREYDCTLTVTFPNKDDGLAVAPAEPDNGSEFKTSRTAAESGYQPELTLHYSFNKWPTSVFGYFIRVRTVLDADGKVRSALYGKIPGNFMLLAGTKVPKAGMVFTYYLNPTANDHNLEFSPKQNLFRTLTIMEEVKWP